MAFSTQMIDDVAILFVSGKLMGGNETTEVQEYVKGLIADKIKKVIIDLSGVKWLNSLGIVMLLSSYTLLQNSGGSLKLAGALDSVSHVFMTTKLNTIFGLYPSVSQALSSFKGPEFNLNPSK